MAQITLTDAVFYKNGEPGHSHVVGFESQVTRVARYTFQSPDTGATELSFFFDYVSKGAGADIPLRFCITTDPESHPNAGETAPYTGTVNVNLGYGTASGEAQVRLSPNRTYYLWLFPGRNAWGWYYFPTTGTVTTAGVSEGVPLVEGDAFLGDTVAITILSSPEYTHRLTWQFGDQTGVIGENLGTSALWTPPLSLAQAIPNSPSTLCTVTCCTYRGDAQVGSAHTAVFTLSVPQSLSPLVSATYQDTSKAYAAFGVYAGKVTKLAVTVTATAHQGAAITATAVLLDGKNYGGSALAAGDHTLTVTATDSRGLTGTAEYPITVLPYLSPQLELTASRCRSDGTPDDTGDHALVTLVGSVTQISGNTAVLTLTYGKTAVDIPVAVGAFTQKTVIPADPNETLALKGRLQDAIRGTTRTMTLSTGYATMDFLYGGKGIAFGTVATREGFQCAMDAQFLGQVLGADGAPLVGIRDLSTSLLEGFDITFTYARVVWVLGTMLLQLKFTCNTDLPKWSTFLSESGLFSGLTENQTVCDITGNYLLQVKSTQLQAASVFPAGTYTFLCALY